MSSNTTLKKIKYALRFIPDKLYVQLYYFLRFKKFINFKNPKTFNEKLNWLKLYYQKPLYTDLSDKIKVKNIISEKIGEQYVIEIIDEWEKFEDINFDLLPQQFVLKCNHDSEGLVIVQDKSKLNINNAKRLIQNALSRNFFYYCREYPYKDIKPKIFAEKYLEDSKYEELRDYKFFCFNGKPKVMFIATNRSKGQLTHDFFDMEFNHLDLKQKYQHSKEKIDKPVNFEKMKDLAKQLSAGIPFVRIDFYEVNGNIYFGEFTFFPLGGFASLEPREWDKTFGDWLDLSNIRN